MSKQAMLATSSRQIELVHCSQVRFCRSVPRLCLRYAADGEPAVFRSYLGLYRNAARNEQGCMGEQQAMLATSPRHSLGNQEFPMKTIRRQLHEPGKLNAFGRQLPPEPYRQRYQ